MGKLSELKGVEKPVTEWLSKMGWTFRSNEDLKVYNRPFSNPVLDRILIERTALINNISKEVAKIAVEQLLQNLNNPIPILGNESFLDKLASHVTITVEGDDIDVHFIDYENIWNNDFIVTNQYWVQFGSTAPPASFSVVIREPRGVPALTANWK